MESTLDGKIVIVTGGNTGIGRATSLQLAAANATVIIASRTESTCKEACDEITSQTGNEKVIFHCLCYCDRNLTRRPLTMGTAFQDSHATLGQLNNIFVSGSL